MKNLTSITLLFAALSFGSAQAGPPAKVTYIANEGFLVEAGSRKILIDAIFDDRSIAYAHVPDEKTLSLMQASAAPFDEIDLVLVTHSHRDHFSVAPVLEHLKGNPSGGLIGPPQVVDTMRAVEPELDDLDITVREVDLDLFESAELEVDGIHVRTIRLRHSAYMETDEETGEQVNRHARVENLIYLVEFEGLTMLHVGDAILSQNLEVFEQGRFQKKKIDIVFLEFFDWSEETKSVLDQWMTPDHVVFMHLPQNPEKIRQIEAHLFEKFPNAVVFAEPMDDKAL
jgi:L-ascorbate metabolism protein UlaG (beta-lactamase superfamily)